MEGSGRPHQGPPSGAPTDLIFIERFWDLPSGTPNHSILIIFGKVPGAAVRDPESFDFHNFFRKVLGSPSGAPNVSIFIVLWMVLGAPRGTPNDSIFMNPSRAPNHSIFIIF